MNKIERIEIFGFWGDRTIDISLFSDVNFFIGFNGTGKTTIINMIAASLSADFSALEKLPFDKIRIKFSEVGGSRKPTVEVEKSNDEEYRYPVIIYKVRAKASEKYQEYTLDSLREGIRRRSGMPRGRRSLIDGRLTASHYDVLTALKSIVDVSWLSIHRSPLTKNYHENSYESSVDQKLEELSNSLAKYFSVLSSQSSDKVDNFKRNIVLHLLNFKNSDTIVKHMRSFEPEEERRALIDLFDQLGIKKRDTESKIDNYLAKTKHVLNKIESNDNSLSLDDIFALNNLYQGRHIIEEWDELSQEQEEVLSPKSVFSDMLSGLFQRKRVYINDRNEIAAVTDSEKLLNVKDLSSGEKQLIIILGEALLHEKRPCIYIADEPELSLHMAWQESLISNLLQLNPNMQIICATHSPDVVSTYSDKIFNMNDKV